MDANTLIYLYKNYSEYQSRGGKLSFNDWVTAGSPLSDAPSGSPQSNSEKLNNDSSYYSQALAAAGDGTDYSNKILGIGANNLNKIGTIDDDIQKKLLDMLLDNITKQEQRTFDQSALQEQRLYDSPINQLMRLMSTGMSRDAALQALQGVAESPLVGSGAEVNAGTELPSFSDQVMQGVGTAFNALSTLSSLVTAGVSLAEAIPQVQMLQAARFMSQDQLAAYKNTSHVTQALGSLLHAGSITFDGLSNLDDLSNYLKDTAKNDINVQSLVGSPQYRNAFNNPLGRKQLNDWWSTVRQSGSEGTLYDNFVRQSELNNLLTEADIKKVGAECALIGTQEDLVSQQFISEVMHTCQIHAEALKTQEEYNIMADSHEALVGQNFANLDLTKANARSAAAQAGIDERMFELNEAGFPMLKQIYLDQLDDEFAHMSVITSKSMRDERIKKWVADETNAASVAWLESITNNAVGDFAEKHPKLWNTCKQWRALRRDVSIGETSPKSTVNGASAAMVAKGAKMLLTKTP